MIQISMIERGYMICKSAHPGSIPGVASNHFKENQRLTNFLDVKGARVAQGAWDKIRDSVILAVMAMWLATPVEAKTIYVATTGDDTANGFSANEPLLTIREAVRAVDHGDTIELAMGIYAAEPDPVYVRLDLTIKGPRTAVVQTKFEVSGGIEVNFEGIQFEQTSVPVRPQIYVKSSIVRLSNIGARWLSGPDPFVTSLGSGVYISSAGGNTYIDYTASPAPDVLRIWYNSYLWFGGEGGAGSGNVELRANARAIYAASSIVTILTGKVRGVGASTDPLILANRMSQVFVNPASQLQTANVGVQAENGSDAYVPATVLFSGVTTPRKELSGGSVRQ